MLKPQTLLRLTLVCLMLIGYKPVFACDPTVPSHNVNLSSSPTASWISPSGSRSGLCCTAVSPDVCVEFIVTLHPGAQGIVLDIASGAIPTGAMFYQVSCGPPVPVGTLLCLNGVGPHVITFCKPGNNPNSYSITSIPAPQAGPPIAVSDGCSGNIYATGYVESSITWSSLPSNPVYNSYMNCSAACDTVLVTAQPGYPASVLYQVCGTPNGACSTFTVCDTVRVYFVNDKTATINPQNPVICFGGPPAALTATGTGGWPPYNYLWSTGATTQTINVTAGTYWVQITDGTNCPPVYDTVTVIAHPSPISANAGADILGCANNLPVTLNGSVIVASGGIWSGGAGTFSPDNTTLNAQYTPSAGEISTGSVTLTLTSTGNGGCPPATDNVVISIGPAPTANAGPPTITVCGDVSGVPLSGSVTVASGGNWTTTGTGTFSPNSTTLNASYIPSGADTAAGSVTITLTTTGNGTCIPVSDQVIITFTNAPTVNAGANITVCADATSVPLSAAITTASGGTWTTSGTGSFTPNANTINASYVPTNADTAAGSVTLTLTSTGNGTCNPVTDQVVITFTNAPTVNAGPPTLTLCADVTSVPLTGTVSTATGGIWTTSGSGSFTPNNTTLNASYVPTSADTAAGSVTLTLTTTGNGTCNAVADQIVVNFTNAPTANAGTNITVCADVTTIPLSGSVSTATGGTWTTSGTGTFIPNANTLNASYDPSNADTAAGTITLTLTTTGNGTCNAVTDQVVITITDAPTVNAGPPTLTLCADVTSVPLTGTITTASGGVWSTTGSGTFSPNNTTINATYIPSNADTAAGSVTLTLTTTGNGGCVAVSDQIVVTFTNAPVANAGANITVCADVTSIPLSGSVSTATGGTWTTSGTGTFIPNATTLNASYDPSNADTAAGTVTLTLTTTGNGTCNPVTDQVVITITNAPVATAGPDQSVCSDVATVPLSGSVSTATGGTWTTSGTGSFIPNANTLNASYDPSNADTAAGSVTLTLTTTGNGTCNAVTDQVVLTFTNAPTVNAGPPTLTLCADVTSIPLTGTITTATGGIWSTTGSGTFSPNNTTVNASYIPSNADTAAGSVTLTLTTTGNGGCAAVNDQIIITFTNAPIANAGANITVCADVTTIPLSGSVSTATGGTWTTSGSGTFIPNANTLNASYDPSNADTAAGTVTLTLTTTGNGTCNAVTDQVVITITDAPTINAGPPTITVCADVTSVPLTGTVTTASGINWTTSGTGTFSPNSTTLNASYIPSSADTAAGSVTLTITSTGNGTCNAVTDQVVITFTNAPTVTAGADITVCADVLNVPLTGTITTATGGTWTTSGTGTFFPNATTLNAAYVPTSADTAAGSVTLTLTSTGNGTCNPVTDQVVITFTNAPIATAGPDQSVCSDVTTVPLSGSVTTATGGTWTTSGTGTFSPNANTLNASYIPSSADTAAGSVTLTLTTTGNGTCNAVTDIVVITFTNAPTVSAGADITVCADVTTIPLSALVTTATGGTWTTSGTGTFTPNANTVNASYVPSAADTAAGGVTLTLVTTGNGGCIAVSDQVNIIITPAPTVVAGPDVLICADQDSIALGGTITTATGGTWTTSGTGTFMPNANTLNAYYVTSAGDTAAGTVTLTLTSTGNGTCNAVMDQLTITITPAPTVTAGPDQTLCSDVASVSLNGIITTATGGMWSTSGTGTFAPNNTTLNAAYIPSAADTAAGTVTLTLVTTGNGGCNAVTDVVVITLTDAPTVSAGPDQIVCSTNPNIVLAGDVTTATGGVWSTSGTGSFVPNNTTLNATYIPSNADTAAGVITLVLTTTGNGLCNTYSDTMIYTITPDAIAVFAGLDQTICAPFISLTGTVNVATGGIWTTTGTGTFTPTDTILNPTYIFSNADTAAGTVTLILTTTGNGGCTSKSDSVTFNIADPIYVTASGPDTACANTVSIPVSTTVTTGSGTWSTLGSGTFTPNNTSLSTNYIPSAADTSAGTVTLIFTSGNNGVCNAITDTLVILLLPAPNPAFSNNSVCLNNLTSFTDLSGAAGGISGWNWNFGDSNSSTSQSPTHTYATDGTYNVTLTVTSNFGCVSSITQPVTVHPNPLAGFNSTAQCFVDSVYFTDISTINTGSIATWSWDFGDSQTSTAQSPGHAYSSAGTYTVTLVVTSGFGCSDTITQTVTAQPSPVAAFGSTIVCFNDPTAFLDSSTIQFGSIVSWNWNFGDSNASTSTNPSHTYANPGTYNVTLIVTSGFGCVDTIVQPVTVNPWPVANFTSTTGCLNAPVVFTDISTVNPTSITSWFWDFGDGDTSTLQNPTNLYPAVGSYTVTLVVFTDEGCVDSLIQTVNVSPAPVAAFIPVSIIVDPNEMVYFTDQSIGNNTIVGWFWQFGDGVGASVVQNPSYSYVAGGYYTVTEIVTNEFGCMDTIDHEVIVTQPPVVPSGFSPNGDGQNDVFYVMGGPFKELELSIYNKWGELIFVSNSQSIGWDGNRQGVQQPEGAYVYTIKAITEDGLAHSLTGDVTLVR